MDDFAQRFAEYQKTIRQLSDRSTVSAKMVQTLRQEFGRPTADLLIEVSRFQSKAAKKFQWDTERFPQTSSNLSDPWWVTDRGFQQSTAWQVARLKSTWLGQDDVWDLCCGIGGDSMALAMRGDTISVDRDPVMTMFADANVRRFPTKFSFRTKTADVTQVQVPKTAAVHIDPSRRTNQRRTVSADHFEPPWSFVCSLMETHPSVLVKLAPATQLDETDLTSPFHRCWIELGGSVREQALLVGEVIERSHSNRANRSAWIVSSDGSPRQFLPPNTAGITNAKIELASQPETWMIDPASSIRAASLTETFANQHGLKVLGKASGFCTTDQASLHEGVEEFAVTGRVVWWGAMDDRKLRRQLRSQNWFPQTIKCRGTDHDPAQLFRKYQPCGETPVTLWIGKSTSRAYAAITN